MKKKLFLSIILIFVILLACATFGIIKVQAATGNYYYPTREEAIKLMDQLPSELTFNFKETEFIKVQEIILKELEKISGRNDYDISVETDYSRAKITLHHQLTVLSPTSKTDYQYKEIKIKYANSKDRNEKDQKLISSILSKVDGVEITLERELKKDGTLGELEGINDISWNELFLKKVEAETGIVDKTIKAISEKEKYGDYKLRIFKNDVYYGDAERSIKTKIKIIIPDNIGNTREEYFNYAKPIIEKMYKNKNAYLDQAEAQNYVIKYNAGQFDKSQEGYWREESKTNYVFYVQKEYYKNGKLVKTQDEKMMNDVKVAKKNEYRGVINAKLKQININEINGKSYLRGKLYVSEIVEGIEGGYSTGITSVVTQEYSSIQKEIHTFDTKMPVVTLVNETGKSYKTEVTKGKDGLYEFKIPVDIIGRGINYKVYAEIQDIKNISPYKSTLIQIDLDEVSDTKEVVIEYVVNWTDNNKEPTQVAIVNITVAKGDITGDGKINTKDAREALLAYIGKKTLTVEQKQAADVNGDGKVNTKDARQILLYYIGKIKEF